MHGMPNRTKRISALKKTLNALTTGSCYEMISKPFGLNQCTVKMKAPHKQACLSYKAKLQNP